MDSTNTSHLLDMIARDPSAAVAELLGVLGVVLDRVDADQRQVTAWHLIDFARALIHTCA
jgi:hypothetical protein